MKAIPRRDFLDDDSLAVYWNLPETCSSLSYLLECPHDGLVETESYPLQVVRQVEEGLVILETANKDLIVVQSIDLDYIHEEHEVTL